MHSASSATLETRLYLAENGSEPFELWVAALKDRKAAAIIRVRLARVRLGNLGLWKFVGGGVSELKIDYGPGYRIYFGRADANTVVLLHGGIKAAQAKDIKKAKEYWADFRRRGHENKQTL